MSEAAIAALGDISGTAYWIARYRALETERGAPLFRDPWAAQLAGDRGRTIVDQLKGAKNFAWAFVIRTLILDRIITAQLTHGGFDTVINLASGLDTRAFRLEIPPDTQWFDVDTASINEHKREILRDATPRCRWEAIATDLSDQGSRQALLADLGARGRKVLAISEGLIHYLSEFQVDALARDLHAVPTVQAWVFDISSRISMTTAQRMWNRYLRPVNARLQFAPDEGTEFFGAAGWREAEHVSLTREAMRLRRVPLIHSLAVALTRQFAPDIYKDVVASGIARLERVA